MSDILPTAPPQPDPIHRATMDMLRSLLMGVGTPLLARGLLTGDQLGAIVGGLLAIASAAWSYLAAHPGKTSLVASVLGFVRAGGRRAQWNGDVQALASALVPIVERAVDARIKARAGILAAPLDAAANAVIRDGAAKAEATMAIPLS
jgi:hypothetical protein